MSDQTAPSTQAEEEQQAGPSGLQNADQVELGVSIPDGVDPSFLDALPEDIRYEGLTSHQVNVPRQLFSQMIPMLFN